MRATPTSRQLIARFLLLLVIASWTSPAALHAVVARATAVAEIVDPAVIDSAKLLAAAGGASQENPKPTPQGSSQPQPQVQVTVIEGVPFLNIDYN